LDVGEKCCSLAGDDDVEQRQSEKEKKKKKEKKEKKQHRSTAQRSTKDAGEVREGRKVKE